MGTHYTNTLPEPGKDDGLVLFLTDLANDVEDGLQNGGQHLLSQHLLPQAGPHVLEPQFLQNVEPEAVVSTTARAEATVSAERRGNREYNSTCQNHSFCMSRQPAMA